MVDGRHPPAALVRPEFELQPGEAAHIGDVGRPLAIWERINNSPSRGASDPRHPGGRVGTVCPLARQSADVPGLQRDGRGALERDRARALIARTVTTIRVLLMGTRPDRARRALHDPAVRRAWNRPHVELHQRVPPPPPSAITRRATTSWSRTPTEWRGGCRLWPSMAHNSRAVACLFPSPMTAKRTRCALSLAQKLLMLRRVHEVYQKIGVKGVFLPQGENALDQAFPPVPERLQPRRYFT